MFQFPGFASVTYVFSNGYCGFARSGFSHSVIPGSKDACSSPRLIAACHDLLRLPVPRHPPYALTCLTILFCLLFPTNRSLVISFVNGLLNLTLSRYTTFKRTMHQTISLVHSGGERVRTDDLLRARQSLSQLSYTPQFEVFLELGLSGVEPPTLRLSVVRSNQLSYRPMLITPT